MMTMYIFLFLYRKQLENIGNIDSMKGLMHFESADVSF